MNNQIIQACDLCGEDFPLNHLSIEGSQLICEHCRAGSSNHEKPSRDKNQEETEPAFE